MKRPSKSSDSSYFPVISVFFHWSLGLFLPISVRSQREASHLPTSCLLISTVIYPCSYPARSSSHKAMNMDTIQSSSWPFHNLFSSSPTNIFSISVSDFTSMSDLNTWSVFHRAFEDSKFWIILKVRLVSDNITVFRNYDYKCFLNWPSAFRYPSKENGHLLNLISLHLCWE